MNIQEEKTYLYEMMKDITQERRKLTDIYYGLKERLDFLCLQEQKGLETLSLKGYTDLHNETSKKIVTENIKRETEYIINEINNKNDNIIEEIIPKVEIEKEKDKVVGKRSGKLNIDKVTGLIITVLKENGTPIALDSLWEQVNELSEFEITKPNFRNNIIRRAMQKNQKIAIATRGYYQYKI